VIGEFRSALIRGHASGPGEGRHRRSLRPPRPEPAWFGRPHLSSRTHGGHPPWTPPAWTRRPATGAVSQNPRPEPPTRLGNAMYRERLLAGERQPAANRAHGNIKEG